MAQVLEMDTPAMAETPCDCGRCEECYDRYFDRCDEFDALLTALQACRHGMTGSSHFEEPFHCPYDFDKGWERVASLARVVERHALALRDECRKGRDEQPSTD